MRFWKENFGGSKFVAHYEIDFLKFSPTANRGYFPTYRDSTVLVFWALQNFSFSPTTKQTSNKIRPLRNTRPKKFRPLRQILPPCAINNEASLSKMYLVQKVYTRECSISEVGVLGSQKKFFTLPLRIKEFLEQLPDPQWFQIFILESQAPTQ